MFSGCSNCLWLPLHFMFKYLSSYRVTCLYDTLWLSQHIALECLIRKQSLKWALTVFTFGEDFENTSHLCDIMLHTYDILPILMDTSSNFASLLMVYYMTCALCFLSVLTLHCSVCFKWHHHVYREALKSINCSSWSGAWLGHVRIFVCTNDIYIL